MLSTQLLCSVALTIVLGYQCVRQYWFTKHINHNYPPGPKGTFWAGNLHDVPASRGWFTHTAWRKIYGDLIHLRIFGQHMVFINSHEDAIELLEKRSRIYSGRSYVPVLDIMGVNKFNTGFIDYNDRWKLHRRIHHQYLNAQNVSSFHPIQTAKIRDMLKQFLHTPEKFYDHYKDVAGAIIMKTIYDIDVKPPKDVYIEIAETVLGNLCKAILPGATLINAIPILRHVPAWVPGASMKRFCLETLEVTNKMIDDPFDDVYKRNPDPSSSVAMKLLAEYQSEGEKTIDERVLRDVCATAYAGGAETVVSSVGSFILAMVLNPDVQARAQKEIGEVVGSGRLPNFGDRDSLPYVEAVYREVLRWRPVAPLGVPHATSEDDTYKGYFIPKGTIIFGNVWALAHDDKRYPQPDVFLPERYFNENGELNSDSIEYAFGFGRRICPGRFMASNSVWLVIALTLAVFNIRKAKDKDGNDIQVSAEYTDALITHPLPFECSITPRSSFAANLIQNDD